MLKAREFKMKIWPLYLLLALILIQCSGQVMIPQVSIRHPANYETIGEPVEGISCEIGILYPADFGRAIIDARKKVDPPADGLIDVEFWYWKPPFENILWAISHHCLSVRGTPVKLIKKNSSITPSY